MAKEDEILVLCQITFSNVCLCERMKRKLSISLEQWNRLWYWEGKRETIHVKC
jgi:hypothetical protein